VEQANIGVRPMFVAKSPQIPPGCRGIVKNISQNISVKNAFRIIPPCNFAPGNPRVGTDARFLGD
jgi:hypothetical protein